MGTHCPVFRFAEGDQKRPRTVTSQANELWKSKGPVDPPF